MVPKIGWLGNNDVQDRGSWRVEGMGPSDARGRGGGSGPGGSSAAPPPPNAAAPERRDGEGALSAGLLSPAEFHQLQLQQESPAAESAGAADTRGPQPTAILDAIASVDARGVDADGEHARAAAPTPSEWRAAQSIQVRGKNAVGDDRYSVPDPVLKFDGQLLFSQQVRKLLSSAGFEAPSPIQAQSWPVCMENRDLISISRTGSGKTLGFLLPIFESIRPRSHRPNRRFRRIRGHRGAHVGHMAPQALVMAPTRELAVQIHEQCSHFGKPVGVRSVAV